MRQCKLALFATAAVLTGTGPVFALEVNKKIEPPGIPAAIWEIAGEFCSIKTWHPAVADCVESKEGDVTFRTLTLKDGGTIKEKLTDSDDLSYSYEIVESPLPVKNYSAKLWVEDSDRANRTVIHWDAEFDANGASDDDAQKKISEIFAAGLKGIKKIAVENTPDDE
jgi:Polyketide cyclase / dehydrase and lipid transport